MHANELMKLLGDLLVGNRIGRHDNRDTRHRGILGRAYGKRLDVEAASGNETRYALQDTGFVLNENGEDVLSLHYSSPSSSKPQACSVPKASSGMLERTGPTARSIAPICSSSEPPGATIGYTCCSREIARSRR